MMAGATRGVLTALLAAAVAVVGAFAVDALLAVVGPAMLLFAAGWPRMTALPAPRGATLVLSLVAVAAAAVATLTRSMAGLGVVVALAVIAAFVHEMVRRDGRPRLVESVAGVVTGAVVVAAAAGWVALAGTGAGALVATTAAAVAVGSAGTALVTSPQGGATVATLLGGATGLLAGVVLEDVGPLVGTVAGLSAGILTSGVHVLFGQAPSSGRVRPALAAAALPVLLAGTPVYVLVRLLPV